MTANNSSVAELQRNMKRFFIILTYAACEWFLLFWLFIDATLSFLLTKFACYCELQIPCLLCSRLDHVFGNENPGFYRDLLCSSHKSELSFFISCGNHGKLVEDHDMCEECLLSSASKSKPNPVTHRSLMGESGCNLGDSVFQISPLNGDVKPGDMRKSNRTHRVKSPKNGVIRPNILVPRRFTHRESLKRIREKFSRSVSPRHLKKISYDPLSHMGYSELKISSDSESGFPVSDDDEGKSTNPPLHANSGEPHDVKCVDSDCTNDLSEKNSQQDGHTSYPPSVPELISLDDFPPLCNTMDNSIGASMEKCELKFPLSQDLKPSVALSELMSLVDAPSLFNFVEVAPQPLQSNSNGMAVGNNKNTHINMHEKNFKSVGLSTKNDQYVTPDTVNFNDSWHPAIKNKGIDASEFVEENNYLKECERIAEELKILPSDDTFAQEVHSHSKRLSQECKSEAIDDCISNEVQNALVMNKVESYGALSLDESIVGEIEGQSNIDHLKRQVERYKIKISALYVELEEERSASAVAANQAMAMITRLQEEKAALHMEGLQYLRMMEEQAEYDVEALEKANDLLAEKEKEIQDLEAELEFLRILYSEESVADITPKESCDLYGKNSSGSLMSGVVSNSNDTVFKSPLPEFSDEKLFISQCLRDLERKLVKFGIQKDSLYISDGECCEEKVYKGANEEQFDCKKVTQQTTAEMKEHNLSLQKDLTVSIGSDPGNENLLNGQKLRKQHEKIDLGTLANEISDLNERLEALETDWNFLEHTLNLLEAGREGLQFVREISYQLQELRKICMSRKSIS